MLLQEVVNTLVQLAVIIVVSLVFWALFGRKKDGFFRWIGLVPAPPGAMGFAFLVFLAWSVVTVLFFLWPEMREAASADNTIAGTLATKGFDVETIVIILLLAGVKTALTEEIFFRGLIGKRMINGFGFTIGNMLQAVLFGAVHLLIFAIPGGPAFSWLLAAGLFLVPGGAGWLMGWVNQRSGNGSILPGWLIHALGNAISYPILAFLV